MQQVKRSLSFAIHIPDLQNTQRNSFIITFVRKHFSRSIIKTLNDHEKLHPHYNFLFRA